MHSGFRIDAAVQIGLKYVHLFSGFSLFVSPLEACDSHTAGEILCVQLLFRYTHDTNTTTTNTNTGN